MEQGIQKQITHTQMESRFLTKCKDNSVKRGQPFPQTVLEQLNIHMPKKKNTHIHTAHKSMFKQFKLFRHRIINDYYPFQSVNIRSITFGLASYVYCIWLWCSFHWLQMQLSPIYYSLTYIHLYLCTQSYHVYSKIGPFDSKRKAQDI